MSKPTVEVHKWPHSDSKMTVVTNPDEPGEKKLYDLGATVAIAIGASLLFGFWVKNTPEGQRFLDKAKAKFEQVQDLSDMYRDRNEPEWAKEAFEAK